MRGWKKRKPNHIPFRKHPHDPFLIASTRASPARKVTPLPFEASPESRTLSDARAVSEREYPEIAEAPAPRGKCVHRVRIASARVAKGETRTARARARACTAAETPRCCFAADRVAALAFIYMRPRACARRHSRACADARSAARKVRQVHRHARTPEYSRAIGRAIVWEGSSLCAHACCRPLIFRMRARQCRLTITVSRILNYNARCTKRDRRKYHALRILICFAQVSSNFFEHSF
jgi:hypothetical protein